MNSMLQLVGRSMRVLFCNLSKSNVLDPKFVLSHKTQNQNSIKKECMCFYFKL